jgi:hypothetical protein
MPRVGFEHTIPVFERAKMFYALDRTTYKYVFLLLIMVGVISQYIQMQAKGWAAGVWFSVGARDFIYSTHSRPPLRPIQSPIPGVGNLRLASHMRLFGCEAAAL